MKNSNTTPKFDYSNLTDEQIKSIALLQHLGEPFCVLDDKVFAVTYLEAISSYNEAMGEELTEFDNDDQSIFYDWCVQNLEQVEEYDEDNYNNDYLVLTDSEADEKAAEYIKETLWAFNAEFLASETGIDYEVFKAIQENGKCEDNNNAIESCIDNMDEFIKSAISADGRGHFMSSYDGEENEESVNGETYFIYRLN